MRYDAEGRLMVTGDGVGGTSTPSTGLTDTQLRAAPVPVTGPATDAQMRAAPLPVTGPLTDAQLRATSVPVTGPATDAQMRAAPLPVSATARSCVGRQTVVLAANTVTTLTVPGGAVAASIQADGNVVRITQDGATAPSSTVGTRIDDGVIYYVDTALASVKLLAPVACSAQVCYFDKA